MKFDRKDWFNLSIYFFVVLLIVVLLLNNNVLYGSSLDWSSQHYLFPEYFRNLFYQTGDLIPDFAFNIGNGQNIYNFAYYGLLSPIFLLSYLMPYISMLTFVQGTMIIVVFISAILFYKWLRTNNFSQTVSFISGFIFMCATPIIFHSHRHIMFISYMPFLLMGLMGIDKYFKNQNKWLMILSIFLMIMTSFYYSISGIITLGVYYIYKYLNQVKKVKTKALILSTSKFIGLAMVGVIMAAIIILPTFYVIISGRGEVPTSIKLSTLLIPKINFSYVVYDSYGVGLTSIVFLALINLFKKNKSNIFMGIILSLLILFPVFNYVMNGTMYVDAKILIPQLPLYVYAISIFIEELFDKKIKITKSILIFILVILLAFFTKNSNYKYFILDATIIILILLAYQKTKKRLLFIVPMMIIVFGVCLGISKNDKLTLSETVYGEEPKAIKKAIDKITKEDKGFYRISNTYNIVNTVNNSYGNIDYNFSTLYSSTYNINYNNFYFDIINNPIQSRNRVITSSTRNINFLMLTSNKYYVGGNVKLLGYALIDEDNKIYKNDNVLPIAYASSNLLSIKDFNNLKDQEKGEALLKSIVVEKEVDNNFGSKVKEIKLNIVDSKYKNASVEEKDGYYLIKAEDGAKIDLQLEQELKNQMLFIRFKVSESQSCSIGDTEININGINNKLTCSSWKYHNDNYIFDYVIPYDNISMLSLKLKKGTYKITDIETYVLDYSEIKTINTQVEPLIVNKNKTKGDKIEGTIIVKEDGYFTASIPYEKGFIAKIDGNLVEVEKVNTSFIGFPITSGEHTIEIEFQAPFKNIGVIVSGIGFALFIFLIIYDNKKRFIK